MSPCSVRKYLSGNYYLSFLLKQQFSTRGDFPPPPRDIWQCLKTFLVASTWRGVSGLLASGRQRSATLSDILQWTDQCPQRRITQPTMSVAPWLWWPGIEPKHLRADAILLTAISPVPLALPDTEQALNQHLLTTKLLLFLDFTDEASLLHHVISMAVYYL